MLRILLILLAVVAPARMCSAAQLAVSNRRPAPDEVGYRPGDGEKASLNPPSLVWLHEPAAATYTVQWSADEKFTAPQTVENLPWNTYTHHEPWQPGTYWWRYRFADESGALSDWSAVRRVIVPPDAPAFPMPTRAQQRQRVPAGHPRLFVRPEDLPALRQLAAGREAQAFAALRAQADRYIAAGPTPEPEHMGSARDKDNAELVKYWWPNREQTMRACDEAEVISFVYMLTRDPEYAAAARRWVMHLASWNPDGPTNFAMNCEAAKPLLYRLPRAYDWAWDALSEDDRQAVRKVMLRRVNDAWVSGEIARGTGHINKPYNSHGNRVWHKVGEAGIAFLGEIPEAQTWLDYAVNKFYACYPVWSDDDGGWHEGVSYWAGYMSKVVWWLQVADRALGIDGLKKPFFAQVGDFPMYIAPPGAPNMGFGDLCHRPVSGGMCEFMDYFIRARGSRPDGGNARYWRWWCEQWKARAPGGVIGFLYRAWLPEAPPAKAPDDLPASKVFRGIGVAALNSNLLDAREGVSVLFKSSPFGRRSHGHNPHNSFQLNAFGEPLLVACTYRDLHGSRFHYQYVHSTAAHNTVLVDGKGQTPRSAAPDGSIAAYRLAPAWDYVMGDATSAYGDLLRRFHRHLVFLKPDVIVIWDDLRAARPATFQFMLHALKEFAVDEKSARLTLAMPGAGAAVQYLSPVPVRFRQWDGFDPPPTRQFPNHWHVEASTQEPRDALSMLTVIMVHKAGRQPQWSVRRIDSDTAVGVRLVAGGQTATVAFRTTDGGRATIDGAAFDAPVFVEPPRP